MFHLTSTAAAQILDAARRQGLQDVALRVAARPAPDGGLDYGMGFDDPHEGEQPVTRVEGVSVLMAPGCHDLLEGTTLDFMQIDEGEFGFVFIPPARSACSSSASATGGCGGGSCGSGGCGSRVSAA